MEGRPARRGGRLATQDPGADARVDDLERSVRFHRDGLGWTTAGIVGADLPHGAVAFFALEGGLTLALWPRASLAHDAGVAAASPAATELSLGCTGP